MSTIYEIINPSDPYTFKADDERIAKAVAIILGEGAYGLKNTGTGDDLSDSTLLLFRDEKGIHKALEDTFGDGGLENFIKANKVAMADAFNSVLCMNNGDRSRYEDAVASLEPDKRQEYRDKVHDKRRSSMNDIGGLAWNIAKNLRKQEKD